MGRLTFTSSSKTKYSIANLLFYDGGLSGGGVGLSPPAASAVTS
jgi:hypothetical protein